VPCELNFSILLEIGKPLSTSFGIPVLKRLSRLICTSVRKSRSDYNPATHKLSRGSFKGTQLPVDAIGKDRTNTTKTLMMNELQ
jgi:hypothetical protein